MPGVRVTGRKKIRFEHGVSRIDRWAQPFLRTQRRPARQPQYNSQVTLRAIELRSWIAPACQQSIENRCIALNPLAEL